MSDRWVSVTDITEHLGVARDIVYRWIESKGLPAYRVGRHCKFKLDEVDWWGRDGGASDADGESSEA
jgi:excisionase family DNA binding protein